MAAFADPLSTLDALFLSAERESVPLFEASVSRCSATTGGFTGAFLAGPSVVPDLEELVYVIAVSFCELLERASEADRPAGSKRTARLEAPRGLTPREGKLVLECHETIYGY
jgi:hypothetical protein